MSDYGEIDATDPDELLKVLKEVDNLFLNNQMGHLLEAEGPEGPPLITAPHTAEYNVTFALNGPYVTSELENRLTSHPGYTSGQDLENPAPVTKVDMKFTV